MDINGISALVTGGASGLGEATARALAGAGAEVTIVDRDQERGTSVANDIGGSFALTDVTNPEEVQGAIDIAQQAGPLRVAVNCAGVGWASRILNKDGSAHDLDLFTTVVTINLIGTFNVMRLAAAAMAQTDAVNDDGERGVIVNTASVAAFDGQIGQIAYSASKGGVVGMTLPAARDLASKGIRVCTIAPGTFLTPMLMGLPEENRDRLASAIPFPKRLGKPEEYGAMVKSIVEIAELNGEVIRLDGALRMAPA
ncbi:MAG: SDR family NAD(P)-dependent oxidoreductase [Acidimicrobiia bacterium]